MPRVKSKLTVSSISICLFFRPRGRTLSSRSHWRTSKIFSARRLWITIQRYAAWRKECTRSLLSRTGSPGDPIRSSEMPLRREKPEGKTSTLRTSTYPHLWLAIPYRCDNDGGKCASRACDHNIDRYWSRLSSGTISSSWLHFSTLSVCAWNTKKKRECRSAEAKCDGSACT